MRPIEGVVERGVREGGGLGLGDEVGEGRPPGRVGRASGPESSRRRGGRHRAGRGGEQDVVR